MRPCRLSQLAKPEDSIRPARWTTLASVFPQGPLRLAQAAVFCLCLFGAQGDVAGASPPNHDGISNQLLTMTVNNADFAVAADTHWKIPAKGSRTAVSLSLCITNQGREPARFFLFNSLRVSLATADGKSLAWHYARDATRRDGWVSTAVAPGGKLEIARPAELLWAEDGRSLRLAGADGFGGFWNVDGLLAGSYELSLLYENHQTDPDGKAPVWNGQARTSAVEIKIE